MSTWDWMNPGEGSMGNVTSSATRAGETGTSYGTAMSDASSARTSVYASVWTGTGAAPWRTEMSNIVNSIPEIENAYSAAKTALTNYANTVEGIKTRTSDERRKFYAAANIINQGVNMSDPIGSGGEVLQAQWHQIEAANALRGLAGERRSADDALVSALARALPESWEDTRSAFQAAGFDSADDLTPAAIAAAMAELSSTVISGSGGSTTAELLAFMEIYGTDPAVMSAYYQQLGGANTVALIDELGDAYGHSNGNDTTALDLAQRLRLGLSIGSENWNSTTAQQFADEMFNALPDHDVDGGWFEPGRVSAIGYLFADSKNAPMGLELTVATAEQVDIWERQNGGGSIGYGAPGFYGDPGMGATSLFGADNPHGAQLFVAPQQTSDPDSFWWSQIDMAGEVFETLALYPNEALDWLTAAQSGGVNERVEYWYGQRDWTVDGFEGASALWSGAQGAEGGPYSVDYDPQVGETIAQLASDVIWQLTGNESFLTENITEQASGSLATGIAPHLDLIADMMLRRDGFDPSGSGVSDRNPFGSDGSRAAPVLSDDVLAAFLAAVGSHDTGALVVQQTIEAYQTLYLAGGSYDAGLLGEALDRSTWLQGALDGSGITGRIEQAQRYDAGVDAAVEGFMDVVNLIPIPAASKLLEGAGIVFDAVDKWALGRIQAELISEGKGALSDSMQSSMYQTATVLAEMENHAQAQTTLHTLNVAHQLSIALGPDVVGEIPAIGPGEDPSAFSQRVAEWWGPTAADLADNPALGGYDIDQLVGRYEDSRDANSYRAQG